MRFRFRAPVVALLLLSGCTTASPPRTAPPERREPAIVPLTLEQEWEMRS